jgi:hypothetical protein
VAGAMRRNGRPNNMHSKIRSVVLAFTLTALAASPALADPPTKEAKTGASVVLANVVYMPAKVLYAAGGGLVAGFAYLFSAGDKDVAKPILDASIGGDYIVEPEHLSGDKKLVFFGQSEEQQRANAEAVGEPVGDVAAQPEPGF